MAKTFAEKALSKAAGYEVSEGDIVTVYPDFCLSHENAASVCTTFKTIGLEKVYDPDRIVIVFDHTVPPPTGGYANSHKQIREFVREQGIRNFYDMNSLGGICHQILCQEGYAAPGLVIVGQSYLYPRRGGCIRHRHRPKRNGGYLGDRKALAPCASVDEDNGGRPV